MKKSKFMLACLLAVCTLGIAGHANKVQNVHAEETVVLDFSEIESFSEWSSSYSAHEVGYENVGSVIFASANKNSQTITNIPVTKGGNVDFIYAQSTSYSSFSLELTKWTTKAQTVTLNTSTDGGKSFTKTQKSSSNFTLSGDLASDVNAIRFTFSSSSNQVGIAKLTLTYSGASTTTMYDVTFDDGIEGTDDVQIKVEEGGTISSSKLPTEPSKNGYFFAGWYNGDTKLIPGTTVINADTKFTARWDVDSRIYVLLDPNDGSDARKVFVDEFGKLPKPEDLADKTDATFAGWYKDDTLFDFNSVITENTTLVAHWNDKLTNISSIVSNKKDATRFRGEVISKFKSDRYIVQDSTGSIVISNKNIDDTSTFNAIKVGNTVTITTSNTYTDATNGLLGASALSHIVIEDPSDTTIDTTPITSASALVEANKGKYFELEDEVIVSGDYTGFILESGAVLAWENGLMPSNIDDDFIDNCEGKHINVTGAFVQGTSGDRIYVNTISVIEPTIVKHTVTFVSNGGKTFDPIQVVDGEEIPSDIIPVKSDYKFMGWYLDNDTFKIKAGAITSDVTVYARIILSGEDYFNSEYVKCEQMLAFDYETVDGDLTFSNISLRVAFRAFLVEDIAESGFFVSKSEMDINDRKITEAPAGATKVVNEEENETFVLNIDNIPLENCLDDIYFLPYAILEDGTIMVSKGFKTSIIDVASAYEDSEVLSEEELLLVMSLEEAIEKAIY